MVKPYLLTVDDDAEVLRAVERDLRSRYAERYRVLRADSGAAALSALRALKKRRTSRPGIRPLSGGEARPAYRLRRHRRRHSRHQ